MSRTFAPLVLGAALLGVGCTHEQAPPATPVNESQTSADSVGPERHPEPINPTDGTAPDATSGTQTSSP
jgi:hypothetical protein